MKSLLIIISIVCLFLCVYSENVFSLEYEITIGKEDNWKDMITLDNVKKRTGKWGYIDLGLADARTSVLEKTDLLLHFNTGYVKDEASHYAISGEQILISQAETAFGEGSGLFDGQKNVITISAMENALFNPGIWSNDFTISFWLYPVTLANNEVIISWDGARKSNGGILHQSLSCFFDKRRLIWDFTNFFMPPDAGKHSLTLSGMTPLLPRRWHHHMIRWGSTSGLIEYCVDGIPEAVSYTTEGNRDGGAIYLPFIGAILSGNLLLGKKYTGLVDEFILIKEFTEKPILKRYEGITGRAMSTVFDLTYTGSRVIGIDAVYEKPETTDIYFFYRAADTLFTFTSLQGDWIQFEPGETFKEDIKGKYIQLLAELFPDGSQTLSPSLSSITIRYEPDMPPPPPSEVFAIAGNGKVTLYWKQVNYYDIMGYEIYYGNAPGQYHGTGSTGGDSPVDVGNVTHYQLTGLENGRLYYFAVVAYDRAAIPHRSIFSVEVNARPSGLLE
jgi:hypothetical protein